MNDWIFIVLDQTTPISSTSADEALSTSVANSLLLTTQSTIIFKEDTIPVEDQILFPSQSSVFSDATIENIFTLHTTPVPSDPSTIHTIPIEYVTMNISTTNFGVLPEPSTSSIKELSIVTKNVATNEIVENRKPSTTTEKIYRAIRNRASTPRRSFVFQVLGGYVFNKVFNKYLFYT